MRRWKELPDSLDQRVRQLVVQLRRLKDRSGLSLASLAAKTEYSRSSWERCLNGKALPPRHALEKLARITGTEPTRLLVLHEVAEKAWQERSAPSPSASADAGSGAEDGRHERTAQDGREARNGHDGTRRGRAAAAGDGRRPGISRPAAAAAVAAAALAGLCAGLLLSTPLSGDRHGGAADTALGAPAAEPSSPAPASSAGNGRGRYVFEPGKSYPCEVRGSGGRDGGALVAGYSSTRTAVLAGPGWDVVEAQCLLQHHRMDPGIVDGVYGQQTIAAVVRLQRQAGLPADGVVGPHTWQVLRG
ncbi:helix-turn-helix domain-containing protein [Streptomyces xinghaiensis]|uniref:helix-turn-helix domain-containing protein n=1 Tax=Streptomyces xinghaiensis TaxID=1038928 RepID=UPI00341E35E3